MTDRTTDRLLRAPEVRAQTGLSDATILRRERAGTFPKRIRIGANSVAWYESEVAAWKADPLGWRAEEAA